MNRRCFAVIAAAACLRAIAAQAPKPADNCTPPPSALAPTLPAKLLPGMGVVHLPITTSSPRPSSSSIRGSPNALVLGPRSRAVFPAGSGARPRRADAAVGVAMVSAGDWRPRFQIDLLVQVQGKQIPPSMVRARAAAKKAMELSQVPGQATDLEKLYIASIAARRNADSKDPDEDFVKGLRAVLASIRAMWKHNSIFH